MFLPIGTDVPIYHRPVATIGLIVANTVAFWQTAGGTEDQGWLLQPRHLAPLEWFSSAFLHFGIMHLVGNMIFLWIFGLIVEGKLGWWKFLTLYLVLCAASGFVEQLVLLGYDGPSRGSGGASGVIYALMAISLVWAPRNCIDVLMVWFAGIWGRAVHQFEVTILTFSLYYIGTDLFMAWRLGFEISTPVLHVLGAAVGFPIGVLLLRRGWVDCEGWDLFSVLRGGTPGKTTLELYRNRGPVMNLVKDIANEQRRQCDPVRELRSIGRMIQKGQMQLAWTHYRQLRTWFGNACLDEPPLRLLIDGLRDCSHWPAVVTLLEEYIERFPQRAARARLIQAAVLAKELQRPKAALRVIEGIQAEKLTPLQRRHLQSARRLAEGQLADGVIELQGLPFVD